MKFIRTPAAQADLWSQWDWYVDQGAPQIADKFFDAVEKSFRSIQKSPFAPAPRRHRNPRLDGLRAWPVKGFDEIRIYYFARDDRIIIARVLHDKRDVASILERDA